IVAETRLSRPLCACARTCNRTQARVICPPISALGRGREFPKARIVSQWLPCQTASRMLQTKSMDSNPENNPQSPAGRSVPGQLVSDATSEINNLLQIISGTCSDAEEMLEGNRGAEKCFKTLRECVGRAGAIAAALAENAGATDHKMLINPQLTALLELQP